MKIILSVSDEDYSRNISTPLELDFQADNHFAFFFFSQWDLSSHNLYTAARYA
jgi:hypothetical protein